MVDGELAAPGPATSAVRRRVGVFALATIVWLASFAVLARMGTWTPLAIAGVALAIVALSLGAVPTTALRPSAATLALGLVVGALMVAATQVAFAIVAALVPGVRTATAQLVGLLNVGGFSPATRAGLVVVIATCEEVLFRGPLWPRGARAGGPGFRRPRRGDIAQIIAAAAVYALAMATLGSSLLVLCAFLCGIIWGAARITSGSLVIPIVAHVVWDLGVLVVWPLAAR